MKCRGVSRYLSAALLSLCIFCGLQAQSYKLLFDKSLHTEMISITDSLTIPDFSDSTGQSEKQLAINSTVTFNSNTEMIPLEHADLTQAHDTSVITISNIATGLDIDLVFVIKGNSYKPYVYYNAVNIGELRQLTVTSVRLTLNHLPSQKNSPLLGRVELNFSGSVFDIEISKEAMMAGTASGLFRLD